MDLKFTSEEQENLNWINDYATTFSRRGYKTARLSKKFALAALAIGGAAFVATSGFALFATLYASSPLIATAGKLAIPYIITAAKTISCGVAGYALSNIAKAVFLTNTDCKMSNDKTKIGFVDKLMNNTFREFQRDYLRAKLEPRYYC